MTTHPSTLRLHQLRYGELPLDEARSLHGHMATCETCAARLQAQQNDRAAFELLPIPEALQNPPRQHRFLDSLRWWLFVPALAAVAALVVVLRPVDPGSPVEPVTTEVNNPSGTRLKGGLASLDVYADREGQNVHLAPGSLVVPGDHIQIRYDPGQFRMATFAGRDGTGVVEVYQTLPVSPGAVRAAPFALELDETPGDQELFAVFSNRELSPEEILDAVDGEGVPHDAVMASIHLRKETSR